MKKIISLFLAVCLIFSLVGCGDGVNNKKSVDAIASNATKTESTPKTDQDKYEQATKYIEQGNYDSAIKLLTKMPEFQDTKKLLYQTEFLYGCTLHNDGDFKNAYEHFKSAFEILKNAFENSEDLKNNTLAQKFYEDNKEYMFKSAYYCAFDLVNNGKYFDALDYFEKIGYNYKMENGRYGADFAEDIIYKLLDGGWTGEVSVDGKKVYVEMIFDSRIVGGDSLTGDLMVKWFNSKNSTIAFDYAEGRFAAHTDFSSFVDEVNDETISLEFDFKSSDKVEIVGKNISTKNQKYTGTFTKAEDGDCGFYKIGFTPTTININQYDFSDNAETNEEIKTKFDEYLQENMSDEKIKSVGGMGEDGKDDIYMYESGLVICRYSYTNDSDNRAFGLLVASEETETSPPSKELCFNTMIPLLSAVGVECDLSISQFDEKLILKEERGNGQIWKTYEYQYSEEILFEVMVVEDPGRQVLYQIMCTVFKK